MPIEIKNSLRSSSIIRVINAGTYNVPITDLSTNTAIETVNSASIKNVMWSTNGSISIVRNDVPLLTLHNAGGMRLGDIGHSIANNSTSNLSITIVTGGTLILEVTKDTSYSPALIGM